MTTNQNSLEPQKIKFSEFIKKDDVKALVAQSIGKNPQRFIASIISAVSNSPALRECSNSSILSCALLGEALNLSPSPQLGHYYMVPFKKKDKFGNVVEINAQFLLGYKGYIQLAMRSGLYRDIDVLPIKEGEYKGRDTKNGKQVFEFVANEDEREELDTIGYIAYFELLNGFRKAIYWPKSKMLKHANQYSQAFDASKYDDFINEKIPKNELWKYSSFWYQNFDEMAFKTLIRNLLSKWGILSIEMQEALDKDEMIYNNEGVGNYAFSDEFSDAGDAHTLNATETDIPAEAVGENFDFFSTIEKQ